MIIVNLFRVLCIMYTIYIPSYLSQIMTIDKYISTVKYVMTYLPAQTNDN